MEPAATDQLTAALNELLEAERAGARVAGETLAEAPDDLHDLIRAVQRDEAHWCGVLRAAIERLGGAPSRATGAFHGKAMAIADLGERLAFLNRGQGWVVRRLERLLPQVGDAALAADLVRMLDAHRANIARVAAHAGDRGR